MWQRYCFCGNKMAGSMNLFVSFRQSRGNLFLSAGVVLPRASGCRPSAAGLRFVNSRTSSCWSPDFDLFVTRFLGVRFGETVVSGSNSFLSFRPFFLLYSVLFCIVGYWGIFCFFVSICLLISNENSLLVFGFSACFCLCLPALFSALFQRRFRERKVVLPNRLSGRFFYFSLYAAAFLFAISVFE